MRPEKTLLLNEITDNVKSSSFLYLVDFNRLTVKETAELRGALSQEGAQFHVIQNTFLKKLGEVLEWPAMDAQWLKGQTGVVFGGENPSGVAKVLVQFAKDREKLATKGGLVDGKLYDVNAIKVLSNLPDLPTLRTMLLSLFVTSQHKFLYVSQGAQRGLLNALKAKNG